MERISLPLRTVTTRGGVAIPVAAGAILLALLWMAHVLVVGLFAPYLFGDFQKVVVTGQDIVRTRPSGEPEVWTLFVEAGRMRALGPAARMAMDHLDPWDGEMKCVYAQAVWRDYSAPASGDLAPSGRLRRDLPGQVRDLLQDAIHCEPMNAFYRQTLVGLEVRTGTADARRDELARAADDWAPQNAWGQLRAAEYMVRFGADRGRVLPHYLRAMDLVSADLNSGLKDPLVKRGEGTPPEQLGSLVIRQVLDGLIANVGGYDVWSRSRDFTDLRPEVHYMLWRRLQAMGKTEEARKESETVIRSVEERLRAEEGVSTFRAFVEIIDPFMRPDYTKRFLTGREIGQAAEVVRQTGRAADAIRLYQVQVQRAPGLEQPRLDLAGALIEEAQALSRQAQTYRDNKDLAQADKTDQEAKARYSAAEEQVAVVQRLNPASTEAIALRGRLPGGAGTPAP